MDSPRATRNRVNTCKPPTAGNRPRTRLSQPSRITTDFGEMAHVQNLELVDGIADTFVHVRNR
jgi:hypothetical protein